jgi:tripartite-type tricarboxylate transporter receptor subunit TctC
VIYRGGKLALALLAALSLCLAAPAWAFDAKTVTIKAGFGAGGSYDMAARLVARHIGRFLPGNPTVIVQNVPGGGSMRLTQLMLGAEPTDGSVIAAIAAGMAYAPALDPANAIYDPLDLKWIGSLARGENMCVLVRSAGIDTIDKFVHEKFLLGASGKNSTTYILAALARSALGAQFDIITGFDGVADIELAMHRGEIAGHCVASPGDLDRNDLRAQVHVVAGFGSSDLEGYESVPRLRELTDDPVTREAVELVEAGIDYSLPLVAPAGTPPETLATLRAAFDAMTVDPAFVEDAGRVGDFILRPTSGAILEDIIRTNLAADPAVLEIARNLVK